MLSSLFCGNIFSHFDVLFKISLDTVFNSIKHANEAPAAHPNVANQHPMLTMTTAHELTQSASLQNSARQNDHDAIASDTTIPLYHPKGVTSNDF
jgi:hypothetical protein